MIEKVNLRSLHCLFASLIIGTISLFSSPLFSIKVSAAPQAWGEWHRVRRGETISGIARKYSVPMQTILAANRLKSPDILFAGEKLFIPGLVPSEDINGQWYHVKSQNTLSEIAQRHGISVGTLAHINDFDSSAVLQSGERLFIPDPDATGFEVPIRGELTVTSKYGYRWHPTRKSHRFHHGIDFRANTGHRVYASKDGEVVQAGWHGGYGNVVVIEHAGQYTTWYAHLSKIRVRVGQRVRRGRPIGLSGSTGHSTGPHLHFEIRWKGRSVDAAEYLQLP